MTSDQITTITLALVPAFLSLMAFLTGLLSWLSSRDNSKKITEVDSKADTVSKTVVGNTAKIDDMRNELTATKDHINSRMSELIAVITTEQRALGNKEGVVEGIGIEAKRQLSENLARSEGKISGKAEAESEIASSKTGKEIANNSQSLRDNTDATIKNTDAKIEDTETRNNKPSTGSNIRKIN